MEDQKPAALDDHTESITHTGSVKDDQDAGIEKKLQSIVGNQWDRAFVAAYREVNTGRGTGMQGLPPHCVQMWPKLDELAQEIGIKHGILFGWIQLLGTTSLMVQSQNIQDIDLLYASLRGGAEQGEQASTVLFDEESFKQAMLCSMKFSREPSDNMTKDLAAHHMAIALNPAAKGFDIDGYFRGFSFWVGDEQGQYWVNHGKAILANYRKERNCHEWLQWTSHEIKTAKATKLCFKTPKGSPECFTDEVQVWNELRLKNASGKWVEWLKIGNYHTGKNHKLQSTAVTCRQFIDGQIIGCISPEFAFPVAGHAPGQRLMNTVFSDSGKYFARDASAAWQECTKPSFATPSDVCMGLHRCTNVMSLTMKHNMDRQSFHNFVRLKANCEMTEFGVVIATKTIPKNKPLVCLFPTPGVPMAEYKYGRKMVIAEWVSPTEWPEIPEVKNVPEMEDYVEPPSTAGSRADDNVMNEDANEESSEKSKKTGEATTQNDEGSGAPKRVTRNSASREPPALVTVAKQSPKNTKKKQSPKKAKTNEPPEEAKTKKRGKKAKEGKALVAALADYHHEVHNRATRKRKQQQDHENERVPLPRRKLIPRKRPGSPREKRSPSP